MPQIPHLRSCRSSRRSNSPTGNPYRSLRWVSDTPAGRAWRRSSLRNLSVSVHMVYFLSHQKRSIIARTSRNFSMCHLLRARAPELSELGNSTLLDFWCQAFFASTKGARMPAPCKLFVVLKLGTQSFSARPRPQGCSNLAGRREVVGTLGAWCWKLKRTNLVLACL